METPKEYHYVYYSYEEYGRGYFGSRTCRCLPKEDVDYFGSFKDKAFKPTQKIILKDDYSSREEAYADEIILQRFYKVVEKPHFANRSYQSSTKFYVPKEKAIETGKKIGKKAKELGTGICGLTKEERIKNGKIVAEKNRKNNVGVYGFTTKERRKNVKITNSQRWMCLETGYVSTPAGVVRFQKLRGIDSSKSNRRRIV